MNRIFYYVYVLETVNEPSRHYTGFTTNLQDRLKEHNKGDDPHTSKYRPWRIRTATAFDDKQRALAFERYLKSHSGRAFSSNHF